MADLDASLALIAALAQQTRTPDQTIRGGLVQSYDAPSNRATVLIDGDTAGTPMSVHGNVTPAASDRCWVTFVQPRGVFLTGLQ